MSFTFYINGQRTDNPSGDKELTTMIRRDSDLGALLITQEFEITYNQNNDPATGEVSGYALLKELWDGGICGELDILIYHTYDNQTTLTFKGTLKAPEFELNEQHITIKTKIRDDSVYAYISPNKNVKYSLYSNVTKSKLAITPPTLYEVDFFDSATGLRTSVIGNLYRGWRVYDVMRVLVPAISDNKVTFESEYLRSITYELFLFDGYALLNPNTDPVAAEVTFGQMVRELFKLKNTAFYIDQTDPLAPVLRLENKEYFYRKTEVASFTDIKNLVTTVRTDQIYGTVKIGAEFNPGGSAAVYTFNSGTSYFGWKEEIYTPIGQCNTDAELDLLTEFIISSNAINDKISGGSTDNLDGIYIVECHDVDTALFTAMAKAHNSLSGSPTPALYNRTLNNYNRLQLHGNNFQTLLNNTLEQGGDGFRASLGQELLLTTTAAGPFQTPHTTEPVIYADENTGQNYDGNGNYDNVTGIFTIPSDGDWSFNSVQPVEAFGLIGCSNATVTIISSPYIAAGTYFNVPVLYSFYYTISIVIYQDNTLAVELDRQTQTYYTSDNTIVDLAVNIAGSYQAGNVAVVSIRAQQVRWTPTLLYVPLEPEYGQIATTSCTFPATSPMFTVALADGYFECNGTPAGGLTVTAQSPSSYRVLRHAFTEGIDESTWQSIVANPIGMFPFEKDGQMRQGWIEEMVHNHFTSQTNIKLISSDAATA